MENSDGFSIHLAPGLPLAVLWALWALIAVPAALLGIDPLFVLPTFACIMLTVILLAKGLILCASEGRLFLYIPADERTENKRLRSIPRAYIRAVRRAGPRLILLELEGAGEYRGPAWWYILRNLRLTLPVPVSANDADSVYRQLEAFISATPAEKGAPAMPDSNRLPVHDPSSDPRSLRRGVLPDELFALRVTSFPLFILTLLWFAAIPTLIFLITTERIRPTLFVGAFILWAILMIPLLSGLEYVFRYDKVELRLCIFSPKRRPARGESVRRPFALRRLPRYRVRKVHTNGRHMYALEIEGGKPGKTGKFWLHVLKNPGRMVLLHVPGVDNARVTRLLRAYASGMNLRPDNAENAKGFAF